MMKKNQPVGFVIAKAPKVGRGRYQEDAPPKGVLESPYYWWFKYLQLNPGYQKEIQVRGKGKLSRLYADFGDVNMPFNLWWREKKGLFAEQPKKFKMVIANNSNELAPFGSKDALNLVLPLDWSEKSLKKKFSTILNQLMDQKLVKKTKRGLNIDGNTAKYRLSGRWRIDALEMAYKIYKIKSEADDAGIKKYWADIAIEAKMPWAIERSKLYSQTEARRTLTILAKRHYARAKAYLNASISSTFP
jgi:hypothetical protein